MDKIIEKILENELNLLNKNIRNNKNELEKIISKDFIEYGSSGNIFTYDDIIKNLTTETEEIKYKINKLNTKMLSDNVILVFYIVEMERGDEKYISNRSSIWVNENNNWKIIFHQGTKKVND